MLRRDFVANVSHELKTPLSVIRLCAETLDSGALEDAQARGGFVTQIIQQSERLSFLIVDLLSIARIESGRESLRPQAIEVAEALEDCLARHENQAHQQGLSLKINQTPPDLWLWMDEEALTQVLDNLVGNAIRYTQASGGTVTLSGRPVPGSTEWVELEVQDTGIGIPETDLPRIFERFFRVEKARSRELGGTGLGLSIVKHLVTASEGTIKATSKLAKGSTFTVRLPRVNPSN
jgi:two-component system phosphate regulon sensor histidine kinase PhoR